MQASPILDLPVQYEFNNAVLSKLPMLFNTVEISNCGLFLMKLHWAIKMSDASILNPAQVPFSAVPEDPQAGQTFN